MCKTESVGGRDAFLNTVALDGLEAQGDARATWEAVAFCIEKRRPFPDWVRRYLASTAANLINHLDNRDERHPINLVRALGFDQLKKPDGYDFDRDPEAVFEKITTWLTFGEVKNVSKGAERYHEDVLKRSGEIGTVRGLYYQGKKRANGS